MINNCDCIHIECSQAEPLRVQCEPVEAVPVDVPEGFSFAQAFTEAAIMILRAEDALENSTIKAAEASSSAEQAASSADTATGKAFEAAASAELAMQSAQALASVALADGLSIGVDPVDGGLNFYRTK